MPAPITIITDPEPDILPEKPSGASADSKGTLKSMHDQFSKSMSELYNEDGTRKPKQEEVPDETPTKPVETPTKAAKTETKPDAKPAAKAPETKVDPAKPAIPDAIKSEKAREHFARLEKERDNAASELAKAKEDLGRLTAEREAMKKMPVVSQDDLKKVVAERDELLSRLEQVALEQSPTFQAKFSGAIEEAKANALSAAGDKHKDLVMQILELPPSDARKKQLAAVMEELEQPDAVALSIAITGLDSVRNAKIRALANHRETARAQHEAHALQNQAEATRIGAVRTYLKDKALSIAREQYDAFKSDGSIEADARVKQYEADVEKAIAGQMTDSEAAMLPVLAAQGAYVLEVEKPTLLARIAELEGELAKVGATMPKMEGTTEPSKATAQKGSSFIAKYRAAMEGTE